MIETRRAKTAAPSAPLEILDSSPLVIEAGARSAQYWKDVWQYRELFYFLAWRDILVRYKQTAIGIAWAVLRPLLTAIVLAFVFGRIARLHTPGTPDFLMVFAGTVPWFFFANSLSDSSNSLVNSANMISKVYFPRLILPTSTVTVNLVDFAISFGIVLFFMPLYHVLPTWRLLFVPCFMLLAFAGALGAGLWLSSLNVQFRDFKYVVPFITQFGLYVSPVGFSSDHIHRNRLLYSLNPTVGVIDGFRWSVLGNALPLYVPGFLISCAMASLLLLSGYWYFRRTERTFADII
ncbi:MAG TPA: ABC transporter permease [Capsulimonadaceae bacterium]|nr:ABC transporter permease [Capsulimonadaceae bacterium]